MTKAQVAGKSSGGGALILVTAVLALLSGCAHEFAYVPVGPGATGGPAAQYPVPPEAPQGEVYVTSFGFTDMDVGPNQPGTMLHARLAVSNGSSVAWKVDGQQQFLVAPGVSPQPPAFVNTDAEGSGPIYQVPAGRASVFDLYFAVPPPIDRTRNLSGFALDWNVDAGGRVIAEQTSFQRSEAPPPSYAYAAYPPYVVVGLGFGIGWWYHPHYARFYRFHPGIHGYYGPGRARGGAWRGAPPATWRGTPPRGGGWRGTPVHSAGAAPHSHSGGGWRGGGHGGGHGH
jgi:hypothetical protein